MRRQDRANTRRFRGGKRRNLTKENLDDDLDKYWKKNPDQCKISNPKK